MSSLVMQMRSKWHKKLNLLKVNRDLTDEEKEQTKQRQREGHARRPDEAKILQKQRQKEAHARRPDEAWALKKERHIARSAKRKENFDFVDLSSITVAFGKDIYSSPYVAATIVADFAGGDKKKRRARR